MNDQKTSPASQLPQDLQSRVQEIHRLHPDMPASDLIQTLVQEISARLPQPKTGPVMCAECGNVWTDCTCDKTGITRNLFAFHDRSGGAYKVWTCEGPVFITHEHQGKPDSLIFLPHELTYLAQTWLAMQENDGTTHEHIYSGTLDPKYEACTCGAARLIKGAISER